MSSVSSLVSRNWGFTGPYCFTQDVLFVLKHGYDIHEVGEMGKAILVADHRTMERHVWFLNDNGGEINLGVLNSNDLVPSVPVTKWSSPLDAGTVAYRIAISIYGGVIDYDYTCPEIVATLKAEAKA